MLKVLLAFLTSVLILAAAYLAVPRVLLKSSGNDNKNQNVPVGKPLSIDALTPASESPQLSQTANRRFRSFADLQAGAGFRPLTATQLPAGYQLWEQYVRPNAPIVVVTYQKAGGYYLDIVERKRVDNNGGFQLPPAGRFDRGLSSSTPVAGRQPQLARVDIGPYSGVYQQSLNGQVSRILAQADVESGSKVSQPHLVYFTTDKDVDIIVEADQTDVSREQLIAIAAGLK